MEGMTKKKRMNLNDFLEAEENKKTFKKAKTESMTSFSDTTTVSSTINSLTNRPFTSKYYDILKVRKTLPAYEAKEKLFKLLNENQVIILQGETGSGKTTQIPQFLLELNQVST